MEESKEVPGPHQKFPGYLTSQEVKVSCSYLLFPLVLFGLLLSLLYTRLPTAWKDFVLLHSRNIY